MSARRSFTASEINPLIPSLDHSLRRMAELRQEIGARANELERLGFGPLVHDGALPPEVLERRRRIDVAVRELEGEVERLSGLGALLSELDKDILEFPGVHEGREVVWSWQLGERELSYYRWPDATVRVPIR